MHDTRLVLKQTVSTKHAKYLRKQNVRGFSPTTSPLKQSSTNTNSLQTCKSGSQVRNGCTIKQLAGSLLAELHEVRQRTERGALLDLNSLQSCGASAPASQFHSRQRGPGV